MLIEGGSAKALKDLYNYSTFDPVAFVILVLYKQMNSLFLFYLLKAVRILIIIQRKNA